MVSLSNAGTYLLVPNTLVSYFLHTVATRAWQPVISRQKGKRGGRRADFTHVAIGNDSILHISEATGVT